MEYGSYLSGGDSVNIDDIGVRPALNLNLSSSDLYTYAGTVCSDGTIDEKRNEVSVTGIDLDETSIDLFVGKTKQLTANVLPSNATNKKVTWKSSDSKVATVNDSGVVQAIGVGIAEITVYTEDGYKMASCKVTVSQEVQATHKVTFVGGLGATGTAPTEFVGVAETVITLPQNPYTKAGYRFVGWTDGTDTYQPNDSYKIPYRDVTFTAVWEVSENPKYSITASSQIGGNISPSGTIFVGKGESQRFTITASEGYKISAVIVDGENKGAVSEYTFEDVSTNHAIEAIFTEAKSMQSFTGTKTYNKTYLDPEFNLDTKLEVGDGDLSYTTSNAKVATVSSSGQVVIRGAGTAEITVSATETEDYKKADYKVIIVVDKAKQIIEGTNSYQKKSSDKTFKLDAELTQGEGELSYNSSNTNIVTVSENGQVTIKGIGETIITVTALETDFYKQEQFKVTIKVAKATCSHTYTTTIIPATTSTNGSIITKCSKCGSVKSNSVINAVKTIALSKTAYTYNGKVQKPSITIKDSKGKTLKNSTDYTVSYSKGMKEVGRYTATIVFKKNYKGTVKKTFDIIPKGNSISKLKSAKKGFSVTWSKQTTQTTGYEISYSTSSKFTKATTKIAVVKSSKTTSKSITKLSAKKKYYVRIRTYKTVKINGKNVNSHSSWSKVKNVTTK